MKMKIKANVLASTTPKVKTNVLVSVPPIIGQIGSSGSESSALRLRVKNLEDKAVGSIYLTFEDSTSLLTLTAKDIFGNTLDNKSVKISNGIQSGEYDENTGYIILTLSDGSLIQINLNPLLDNFTNLQNQINNLNDTKLDKSASFTAEYIDYLFEEIDYI